MSRKIERVQEELKRLTDDKLETVSNMTADLKKCSDLLIKRNEFIHGKIKSGSRGDDTLVLSRPNKKIRNILEIELYDLANKLYSIRTDIKRPVLLRLKKFISSYFHKS